MGKINWTYLGTILSIGFGWLLNEFSQWFRKHRENIKIKRKILYNLLEINFIISRLNTYEITQIITDKILIRIPENEQTDELIQYLKHQNLVINRGYLQPDVALKLKAIEEKYTNAVDNLATIDPITAYKINGKTNIMQSLNQLQDYFDEIKVANQDVEELNQNQVLSIVEDLKLEYIKELICDIENEIKHIAFSINLYTWIKVKRILQLSKDIVKNNEGKKIDEFLEKIIPN
jgi:hypothetical protein